MLDVLPEAGVHAEFPNYRVFPNFMSKSKPAQVDDYADDAYDNYPVADEISVDVKLLREAVYEDVLAAAILKTLKENMNQQKTTICQLLKFTVGNDKEIRADGYVHAIRCRVYGMYMERNIRDALGFLSGDDSIVVSKIVFSSTCGHTNCINPNHISLYQ